MSTIRKQLRLPKIEYYTKHLSIVNIFLPVHLTPNEIKVLATFMSLEGDIAEDRFGPSARKIVMHTLGLKPGGLGNYLKSLKIKNFLKKDEEKKFEILPLLYPDTSTQEYTFQLVNNG